jgi:hypothetical protein
MLKEVISQQQSSAEIGHVDEDDKDWVYVQPGGGVVIVKSRHGCLREPIDSGSIFKTL